jgi:hypothetical protein
MPTSKSPQLSPSALSKHLRMESVCMPHHIMKTRMELWGFIKPSVQNKVVHMEVSLCLSFYLRCSLGGYTVVTTMGFPIETMQGSHR